MGIIKSSPAAGARTVLQEAARMLRRALGPIPPLAIVLGSGFGGFLNEIKSKIRIPYGAIPGFARTTVAGHDGTITCGTVGNLPLLALSGRSHYYEGHSMEAATLPIRVLAALGVRDLLLTNAAGGIRASFRPGDFMVIRDHINFMGANPLRGYPDPATRFVDLTACYDPELRTLLKRCAKAADNRLQDGVYLAVSGPSYETPAEIRAFRKLGADAVGMSTVPEAIVARHCGVRVAGLSCITNPAAGLASGALNHQDVLDQAGKAAGRAARLLHRFLGEYAKAFPAATTGPHKSSGPPP